MFYRETESLGHKTWKQVFVTGSGSWVEWAVVPAEAFLLPWEHVCSWLLKVFWLFLTLARRISLSGNGGQSSSACSAVQVQTEASLGCFFFVGEVLAWGWGVFLFVCFAIFNELIMCLHFVALAMGLCVAMIAFVRLPSLKVSCLLLSGLLIYDVFWVSVLFGFAKTVFILWICNWLWAIFTWIVLVVEIWQSQKISFIAPFWDVKSLQQDAEWFPR